MRLLRLLESPDCGETHGGKILRWQDGNCFFHHPKLGFQHAFGVTHYQLFQKRADAEGISDEYGRDTIDWSGRMWDYDGKTYVAFWCRHGALPKCVEALLDAAPGAKLETAYFQSQSEQPDVWFDLDEVRKINAPAKATDQDDIDYQIMRLREELHTALPVRKREIWNKIRELRGGNAPLPAPSTDKLHGGFRTPVERNYALRQESKEERGLSKKGLKKNFDGVSLGRDNHGYFCYTHRCRSKSYPTADGIPQSKIDFVSSTG